MKKSHLVLIVVLCVLLIGIYGYKNGLHKEYLISEVIKGAREEIKQGLGPDIKDAKVYREGSDSSIVVYEYSLANTSASSIDTGFFRKEAKRQLISEFQKDFYIMLVLNLGIEFKLRYFDSYNNELATILLGKNDF